MSSCLRLVASAKETAHRAGSMATAAVRNTSPAQPWHSVLGFQSQGCLEWGPAEGEATGEKPALQAAILGVSYSLKGDGGREGGGGGETGEHQPCTAIVLGV